MDTVLLIETDRAKRKEMATALTNLGFRVKEAASLKAALSLLQQGLPRMVVLPDDLPGEDGALFLSAIRRQVYVPILVLGTAPERAAALLDRGADAYLPRRPTLDMLSSQVRALMRLRRGPPPQPPPDDARTHTPQEEVQCPQKH